MKEGEMAYPEISVMSGVLFVNGQEAGRVIDFKLTRKSPKVYACSMDKYTMPATQCGSLELTFDVNPYFMSESQAQESAPHVAKLVAGEPDEDGSS